MECLPLGQAHSYGCRRLSRWTAGAGFHGAQVADIVGYAASATDYERYDVASHTWSMNQQRPQPVWIQQLYGELKWRSLFLTIGLKQHGSALLDNALPAEIWWRAAMLADS